ncbi:PP2C family protein-serine/threonine phosphatase [Kineococcus sp. SYSU DK005]|uniref:PP2C family protein-serine/threonine phosphatase n=1 Tax=Kineococcus sp. SYSU DK005 TaxID=3383126 RepID=UPI003D7D9A21
MQKARPTTPSDVDEGAGRFERLLARAVRTAEQAVCIADVTLPDEPLVWVNDAFTVTTGYAAHEALGRNCRFLQEGVAERGHDARTPAARLRELIRSGRGGTVVVPNLTRDGRLFHNELSLSPLVEPDGTVRHYVAVQRDVTDRVEAQAARDAVRAESAALADQIQRTLVPARLPHVPGYEVALRYQPATRADGSRGEVSGDFYDLLTTGDGGLLAVIGDVSGRGPRAAATTTALRWAARGLARATASPAALLSAVGDAAADALDDRFATLAAVRLPARPDPAAAVTGAVALAGHPQPVLLPAHGEPRAVGVPGTLIGLFEGVDTTDAPVALGPGDCLVLFTDGVTEAADAHRDLLDDAGLLAALRGVRDRTSPGAADRVADAVLAAVSAHVAGGPVDDLTLVVLRAASGN